MVDVIFILHMKQLRLILYKLSQNVQYFLKKNSFLQVIIIIFLPLWFWETCKMEETCLGRRGEGTSVLVWEGFRNQVPQTGWLKGQIYSLNVLEATSLRSRCWQFLLKSARETVPALSPSSWWLAGHLWCSLACRCTSLCLHVHSGLSVYGVRFPFFEIKTPVISAYPPPVWLHLN